MDNISSAEAARSLADIENSQAAMRSMLRAYRGHWHLWLWGSIWVVMAMLAQFKGQAAYPLFCYLDVVGIVGSILIGFTQGSNIRKPFDKRFVKVLIVTICAGIAAPFVIGPIHDFKAAFAYAAEIPMLCYIIAGIWFDTYLFWLGLLVAASILVGLFLFSVWFWWIVAIFGGGALIGTGFYVRFQPEN